MNLTGSEEWKLLEPSPNHRRPKNEADTKEEKLRNGVRTGPPGQGPRSLSPEIPVVSTPVPLPGLPGHSSERESRTECWTAGADASHQLLLTELSIGACRPDSASCRTRLFGVAFNDVGCLLSSPKSLFSSPP